MVGKGWLVLVAVAVFVAVEIIIFLPLFIQPSMQEMVPPALAAFYDTFDHDNNNMIEIVEAERFYNWCRGNIHYRYDDEQEPNPAPGIPVGDGRPGIDYWQKPIETYNERMGDCEDMAIFSAAFYRYHGVSAYIVPVNVEGEEVDHAICAVNIGRDIHEIRDHLGGIVYYEREDGCYMIVDVAYSDKLGHIGSSPAETTKLIDENRFIAKAWITLEQAYKMSG